MNSASHLRRRQRSAELLPAIREFLETHGKYGEFVSAQEPIDGSQIVTTTKGIFDFLTDGEKVTGMRSNAAEEAEKQAETQRPPE